MVEYKHVPVHFERFERFMRNQQPSVITFTLLALASSSVLSDNSSHDTVHKTWQQGFPLSIIDNQNDPVGRPDLNRPMTYRNTQATNDQIDPLQKTASVVFGPTVRTVGEAAKIVLEPVGYEMVTSGSSVSPVLARLLRSPLPDSQRDLTHLRVNEMLRALAGIGYVPVFDHIQRKATFDPIPRYIRIGGKHELTATPLVRSTSNLNTLPPEQPLDKAVTAPINSAPISGDSIGQWKVIKSTGGANEHTDWQEVTSTNDTSFSEQVADVLKSRASSAHTEVVTNSVAVELLEPSTEMALRRIAHDYDPAKNKVIVSNCSGNVPQDIQLTHQVLIGSAMRRLGIDDWAQATNGCRLPNGYETPGNKTQYVIELLAENGQ